MNEGLWIPIIGALLTAYGIYSNNRHKKAELRLHEREIQDEECKIKLAEMSERVTELEARVLEGEQDRKKLTEMLIDKFKI